MSAQKPAPIHPASLPVVESAFSRLIVAPVLFVSFLVSLFLIDRQHYSGIFSHSSSNEERYYRSHQKKLAKREMDDAFQLRGKVIAAMVMAVGVVVAVLGWVIVWMGGWLR